MPAPCKVCGFVDSAELMKQHMVEKHGADKRTLKTGHPVDSETSFGPTVTAAEAQASHVAGDRAWRELRAKTGKGSVVRSKQRTK